MKKLRCCQFFLFMWLLPCTLIAQPLSEPTGPVILTVTGQLANTNRNGSAEFDEAMLSALPQHRFTTSTPWTEGKHEYQGVKLAELFKHLGVKPTHVQATALNHYSIGFNYEEVKDYPIILARTKDGQPMRIRDKGPLWILYPMSDHPELNNERHHSAMVWQLRSIEVK